MTEACVEKVRRDGIDALPSDWQQCFKWTPPQRWQGLWVDGFEFSRFCPSPATECSSAISGKWIWLSESPSAHLPVYRGEPSAPVYAVDFVGRKTAYPGRYSGLADQEIIVDRMISMRRLKR